MDMQQPLSMKATLVGQAKKAFGDRSIGAILIDSGRLTYGEVEKVLREQRARGLRFGDAAVSLGLLRANDIQFALSRQFDYPYLEATDDSINTGVVAAFRSSGVVVEQLRALRSQLMVRWLEDVPGRRSIVVASPERGEGRSFIAANLAVVFSQLGERTLLIDADMRDPVQHKLFKLPDGVGLSNLLAGRAGDEAIVKIGSLLGLSVLPAGTLPPNPQELLARSQFAALLARLESSFDVIVIDSPALALADDVSTLTARARAALLVGRKDRTSFRLMQALTKRLVRANGALVGSVLNQF